MKIAIITGASSGLGREYLHAAVRQFAQVEEFWLIARRRDRLEELTATLEGRKTRILPLDLTKEESFRTVEALLATEKPEIQLLINNAGFGLLGEFAQMDFAGQTAMVDLNVRALTALSSLALPYMHKGSVLLNVCSIAAFAPNPRMTVYSATKAYVFSFSKSLREELRPQGVHVLAVCPGPMSTEFLSVAGISGGHSKTFERLPYCNPHSVAEISLKKAAAGKAVYTNRLFFKFYRVLAKLLPHNWIMKLSKT